MSQIDAQLYSLCEDSVQNSIVNTNGDFFFPSEKNMTQIIETIVTKYSSPAVHCLNFANLSEGDLCKTCLIVWLNSIAQDCAYSHSCQAN